MVLVDEANAGGTPEPECPCENQDIRSLAGVMKPASVTVYDDGIRSPCVGGMLSSSDVAGRLLPVGVADAPALSGRTDFGGVGRWDKGWDEGMYLCCQCNS